MRFRKVILLLSILLLLVAISPAIAETDDFQDHPGNLLTDKWVITSGTPTIAQYPSAYTQQMALKGSGKIKLKTPVASNYWAFSAVYIQPGGYCSNWNPQFFNSTGASLGTLVLDNVFICADASYTHKHLFEFIYSSGVVTGYLNGVEIGSKALASQPYNIEIYVNPSNSYFDDFTTETGIIGMNRDFTETDQTIQASYSVYSKWAYPASTYRIRLRNIASGSTINTTTVSEYSGYTPWNTLNVFGYNYGPYEVALLKDEAIEARHYINYASSINRGSIYWDQDSYVIGDNPQVSYHIEDADFVTYVYGIRIVKASDFSTVETTVLQDYTSYLVYDTSDWGTGTYYAILQRAPAGGTPEYLAWDFADFETGIKFVGTTYDLETGAVLGNVSINFRQGDQWYNTTSNGTTGAYNLSGLTTGVNTLINASKANYTHENFSYIPETGGTYPLDLYLLSGTPAYAGNAILGQVYSYPWHQKIQGATVNIWNGSWSDTATTSSTGYYIFNNLSVSPYTMNATMTDYTSALNVAVSPGTPTRKDWLLHPIYTLTIRARDSVSQVYLGTFTASIGNEVYNTSSGIITATLDYDTYTVQVAVAGYSSTTQTILLDSDKTLTFDLTPATVITQQITESIASTLHPVRFIVQGINGVRYPSITVSVYEGSNTTAMNSSDTGTDGAVVFKLYSQIQYRITFINSSQGISREATLYPIEDEYIIYIAGLPGDAYGFSYNISNANNNITLIWADNGILQNLNYTIYNGTRAQKHQLITTNTSGTSSYSVVNTSDIYYVYFTANTTKGLIRYYTIFDYRLGQKTGRNVWGYGSFVMPSWLQNVIAFLFLLLIAGSFGAIHSGLGGIMTGLISLYFWSKGWLDMLGAGAGILAGLVVITIIYYIRNNQRVTT